MISRLFLASSLIALSLILPTPPLVGHAQDPADACLSHAANFDTAVRIGRGEIYDMALSSDGTMIAAASGTGLWIYDAATVEDMAQFKAPVSSAPDTAAGLPTPAAPAPPQISPPDGYVPTAVTWSPDSQQIAAGYADGVRIWDVATGQVLLTLPNLTLVTHVAWSPDGAHLAILHLAEISPYPDATEYYDLVSYEIATQALTPVAVGIIRNPDQAVWSPDSTHLLYVSSYRYTPAEEIMDFVPAIGAATIWDSTDGTSTTFTPTNASGYFNVQRVAWSADGSTIAINAIQGENDSVSVVQWWDVASLSLSRETETRVTDLQWGGATLFMQSSGEVILDDGDSTSALSTSGDVRQIAVTADASRLIINSANKLQVIEVSSGEILVTRTVHISVHFFPAWSHDGQYVALSELSNDRNSALRQVFIFDLQGQVVNSFDINYGHNGIVWSPDDSMLAVAEYEGMVLVRLADHEMTRIGGQDIYGMAWSPDGTQIASITDAGDVTLYTLSTGESQTFAAPIEDLDNSGNYLNTRLQWTANGLRWLLGDSMGVFRVYGPNWETGQTVQLAEIGPLRAISLGTSPEFTIDGNLVYIPNHGDMTVFDVSANAISATYPTAADNVIWSAGGGCYDWMVNGYLWVVNTRTGDEINLMPLPVSPVWGYYGGGFWSPTGDHLVFLLGDGTAMIWGVGADAQ